MIKEGEFEATRTIKNPYGGNLTNEDRMMNLLRPKLAKKLGNYGGLRLSPR